MTFSWRKKLCSAIFVLARKLNFPRGNQESGWEIRLKRLLMLWLNLKTGATQAVTPRLKQSGCGLSPAQTSSPAGIRG